jgi:prevent-host-death family protein
MMTINVAELKAHLSEYLRRARRGERIVVRDRKVPIVELVAVSTSQDPWERLAREKGLKLGTQSREPIRPVRTRKKVDWARFLREAQENAL